MEPFADRDDGPRLWLVFFGDGERASWWDLFTRPGFRHVCGAAWYGHVGAWVFYDVSRQGTEITVLPERDPACGRKFGQWIASASLVLRFPARAERRMTPAGFYCVGAIKSLLGIAAPRALWPSALARHLLRLGAEKVEVPRGEAVPDPEASAGGPVARGGAPG